MSINSYLLLVEDSELRELLAEPARIHRVLADIFDERRQDWAELDKMWHALHFFMTGDAWEVSPPLDFLVFGGQDVGDEDVGFGPARAFFSPEVAAIANALRPIDTAEIIRRFDAKRMNELEIYPSAGNWHKVDPHHEECFEYFTIAFGHMKDLLTTGASSSLGMLAWFH